MIKSSILIITISMILSIIAITEHQQTAYAGKDEDNNEDELSERDIAELCGASEDYERNQEQCYKLYDMLEEGEIEDDPDFEYD
jgi:hypothetical protein